MKDPSDKYTEDMYVDFEASEERLDQEVKQWLWSEKTKKFEPYPMTIEDWYERLEDGDK